MQCIFCKIISGDIDSAKVYEDDTVLAFLDVNPISKGHTLVIPKEHFENIFDIPEDHLQKLITVAKKVATTLKISLKADGINLLQANGKTAGQVIDHFHLHVAPRHEGDGLNFHPAPRQKLTIDELKKQAQEIKKTI